MSWAKNLSRLSSHFLIITLPTHILFGISIYLLTTTSKNFSYMYFVPVLWFLFSGLGIAIGYHRLLSHKSFQASTFMRRALSFLGVFACQGSPIFWTAIHRSQHHPFSDTEKDPHTPSKGFWFSYIGWQMFFSAKDFDPRHAIDLVKDPFLRRISTYYYQIFWAILLVIALVNWNFFIFALIPAMILSTHQENIVNSFCHTPAFGYRNFQHKDNSRNVWILGFLFFGQGYHNNHHAHPAKASFAHHWWEFDICPYIIFFLSSKKPHLLITQKKQNAQ